MRNVIARSLAAATLLLAVAPAAHAGPQRDGPAQVSQIPFSDWLSAQQTGLVAFQGRVSSQPFAPLGNIGVVDYANGRTAANNLSFGFSASGNVTLMTNSDGTGLVRVNESFSNAVNWAFDVNGVPIFGYSPHELATSSATAALANGHLQVVYTVPDASQPELNLANVVFNGGGTLSMLKFYSEGSGPLRSGFGVPDGTPGKCIESNTGLFNTSGGATADGFPVEHVDVFATTSATAGSLKAASRPATVGSWGTLRSLYR